MGDGHLLRDLRLQLRQAALRPVYQVALESKRIPGRGGRFGDFGQLQGRDNLGQAVIMRLLTPRGELSTLGHPNYGSRLHELIGRQNTATQRDFIKLYILESLQQEPRIASVESIAITPTPGRRDRVDVLLIVQPVAETATVTIGPFTLELGP